MNAENPLFASLFAFAMGYGLAYFTKNIGRITERFGLFVIFIIPPSFAALLGGAAIIADQHDVLLSCIFAFGFIFKMMRKGR